jgi:hypothetical protein
MNLAYLLAAAMTIIAGVWQATGVLICLTDLFADPSAFRVFALVVSISTAIPCFVFAYWCITSMRSPWRAPR